MGARQFVRSGKAAPSLSAGRGSTRTSAEDERDAYSSSWTAEYLLACLLLVSLREQKRIWTAMQSGWTIRLRSLGSSVQSYIGRSFTMAAVWYALAISFPLEVAPIRSGIDPSWMYTLNTLPGSGYVFGKDILFTYGPLGFLLAPLDVGVNASIGLWVAIAAAALFCLAACRAIAIGSGTVGGLTFAVSLLLAAILGLQYESVLLLVVLTLALLSLRDRRYGSELLVLGSILSSCLLYLKFNLGVVALVLVLVAAAGRVLVVRPTPWKSAIVSVVVILSTVGGLGALTTRSVDNFVVWARGSVEIAAVYDVSQSIHGPSEVLVLGVVALAIGAAAIWTGAFRPQAFVPAVLVTLVFIAAFKHGFVRQDLHVLLFFPVVVAGLGITSMFASPGRLFAFFPIAVVFTALLGVPAALFYGGLDYWSVFDVLRGARSTGRLAYFWTPDESARLADQSKASLSPIRLPDEWLRRMAQTGGKVDVLPYESSLCAANSLPCIPTEPAYVLSSPWLDAWNAARYQSDTAPAYLIVEFPEMDGRNPVQSMPRTWSTILDSYEAVPIAPSGQKMLLQRKAAPGHSVRGQIAAGSAQAGEVIELPPSDRLLFARFDLELKPENVPVKTVFRIPPVELETRYASGKVRYFRLLPGPAGDGVPLNVLPRNTAELVDLMGGVVRDPVASVRIIGEGARYFEPDIQYRLEESTYHFGAGIQLFSSDGADLPDPTSFQIFYLNDVFLPRGNPGIRVSRAAGKPIRLTGWAIDDLAWRPASGVTVRLDGQMEFPATYGLRNKDVARILQNPEFLPTGFEVDIPVRQLAPGPHTLELRILRTDGEGSYDTGPVISFFAD